MHIIVWNIKHFNFTSVVLTHRDNTIERYTHIKVRSEFLIAVRETLKETKVSDVQLRRRQLYVPTLSVYLYCDKEIEKYIYCCSMILSLWDYSKK